MSQLFDVHEQCWLLTTTPPPERTVTGRIFIRNGGRKSKGKVKQWTLDGKYVETYDSTVHAAYSLDRTSTSGISDCINGKQAHAHGFLWTREEG